jgi:hypothetical protein
MAIGEPIQATVLREPSPDAVCSCTHSVDCVCACHDRHCDPSEELCHIDFLPDEGGLTYWGCTRCSPGQGSPHFLGCELIGWNVPVPMARVMHRRGGSGTVSAFG